MRMPSGHHLGLGPASPLVLPLFLLLPPLMAGLTALLVLLFILLVLVLVLVQLGKAALAGAGAANEGAPTTNGAVAGATGGTPTAIVMALVQQVRIWSNSSNSTIIV